MAGLNAHRPQPTSGGQRNRRKEPRGAAIRAWSCRCREVVFQKIHVKFGGTMDFLNVAAIVFFLLVWVAVEPLMAVGWPRKNDSLSVDMVRIRAAWMREVLTRDNNFIGDAAILGHTINSASFFGSANLIVIVGLSGALFMEPNYGSGGLIAMFAAQDPAWFFQCKVLLIMATLLRGLSDFIWAVRQINYCLAAIGASPSRDEDRDIVGWTNALTLVLNPALRSFSVGVRSYYFTVAAAFWFIGPIPFIVATILSVGVLIWRQSWSDAAKGIMAIRKLLD
ncbi:putative membrane protein [Rhizobium sp. BK226]|nr:putative membrane protein [Rhizobium sp. BK112]MBB3371670.1 putative membrane protein [Rhizobium sp. BK077]MBB3741947.1 putative membrane protein [Rhizobium sp. BK591]MBB4113345.1 putative membrane protein [Rhizobium sp. BK226]MBB4182440.1 putative membrane protein [Rhizobium sp. BK109]MBB4250619.1 putative membrane protein [Rhizobium sp. BK008]